MTTARNANIALAIAEHTRHPFGRFTTPEPVTEWLPFPTAERLPAWLVLLIGGVLIAFGWWLIDPVVRVNVNGEQSRIASLVASLAVVVVSVGLARVFGLIGHRHGGMVLRERFGFIDDDGETWIAGAGCVINGASIPRFLWPLVGAPYTGRYRNASVLHDVACQDQTHDSRDVHRMFWCCCRATGIGPVEAWLLWVAVRTCGPRFRPRSPRSAA